MSQEELLEEILVNIVAAARAAYRTEGRNPKSDPQEFEDSIVSYIQWKLDEVPDSLRELVRVEIARDRVIEGNPFADIPKPSYTAQEREAILQTVGRVLHVMSDIYLEKYQVPYNNSPEDFMKYMQMVDRAFQGMTGKSFSLVLYELGVAVDVFFESRDVFLAPKAEA